MLKPPSGPRRRVGPLPRLRLRASRPDEAASEERGSRVRHALGMQWAGMICQVRRSVLVVRDIDPEPLPERPQDGPAFGARESPTRRLEQAVAAVRAALQQEHTTSTSLLPIPPN